MAYPVLEASGPARHKGKASDAHSQVDLVANALARQADLPFLKCPERISQYEPQSLITPDARSEG
jgi:hypothetical protein